MLKCPHCGVELQLVLQLVEPPRPTKTAVIKGVQVSDLDIRDAARRLEPERIRTYAVSLEARSGQVKEFPIKPIVRAAVEQKTGSKCPAFNSHDAARLLTKLGFQVRGWQG